MAELHKLEPAPMKSDKAIREILLGWIDAAVNGYITEIEIRGIVDGEPRSISYVTAYKPPEAP